MTTMNISLPEEMKAFVDAQVAERRYGNASEYMRDLIRRDLAREQFRAVILSSLESGPSVEWTPAHFDALRDEIAQAESTQTSQPTASARRRTGEAASKTGRKKKAD